MKINIRGKNIEVTESIKKYIEDKLSKLNKYFDKEDTITSQVLIKVRKDAQIVEITIPTKNYTLRAEEESPNLYASIDTVLNKLERQIRKNKTRLKKISKKEDISDFNLEFDEEEQFLTKVVKRKTFSSKPMDEEEAMIELELLNHDFFIFKNIDEDCTSVIYRRKDDNYGIINIK